MMSKKTFKAQLKRELKPGQRISTKQFKDKWAAYVQEQKAKEQPKPQAPTPVQKPQLAIAAQAPEILQKVEAPKPPEPAAPDQPVAAPVAPLVQPSTEIYEALANSMHQLIANVVKLATKGQVVIEGDKVKRLDLCAVKLCQKYDTSGKLQEWGPELAYFAAMADISTQVYVEINRKQVTAKPKEAPAPLPVPTGASKEEASHFSDMLGK